MRTINELIVVSDIHLTPERNTVSFRLDKELADFLHWVLTETHDCVVALAGDVFDFLTVADCPAKSDFDRLSCLTNRIIEHHPEIFDALARLAQSPRHMLVIISGEYDSELMCPQVQETIERRLGFETQSNSLCWRVLGESLRLRVGPAAVLVEHGHALDRWNKIDYASLQPVLSLDKYYEPLGVELIARVIRNMRGHHPWIDCLKPANESILPLLWPFASEHERTTILELARRYERIRIEALLTSLSSSHDPNTLYRGDKEVQQSPQDRIFKEWVDTLYDQQNGRKTSNNGHMIEKVRAISNQDRLLEVEQPSQITNYLQPIFENGTDLVIHGHTRAARICDVANGIYLNTGTWGQIQRLPQSYDSNKTWQQFLQRLDTGTVDSFARPTFVHVHNGPPAGLTAALMEWRSRGPETLGARQLPSLTKCF